MAHDVFISYSSKDKPVADAACAVLERNGLRCWVAPRDILPGASWATSILKAINEARLVLLVFSADANRSPHIRREVERAVSRGIPVAPVRIEDVLPADEMEYFLSSSHWMDAFTPPLERHFEEIARKVRLLLDATAAPTRPDATAERTNSSSIAAPVPADDALAPPSPPTTPSPPKRRRGPILAGVAAALVVAATV
jgi:hypothetical protein